MPENDAGLDPAHWTGHTGCVILAPHLITATKKAVGLPHWDAATERQRRDGMCWKSETELYNNGIITSIPSTASEFEQLLIRDEISLETLQHVQRVDTSNAILSTPVFTDITLDNDYMANNFGLEYLELSSPIVPLISIDYPQDIVRQVSLDTQKIQEQEKLIANHEARITVIEDTATHYGAGIDIAVNGTFDINANPEQNHNWINVKMSNGAKAVNMLLEISQFTDGDVIERTIQIAPAITGTLTNALGIVTFTSSSGTSVCRINFFHFNLQ